MSNELGDQKVFYFIVLVSVLMAILYGFFAVTANPIIIGLAAALIVGLVLLVKPSLIVWLILLLSLLVTGLLPLCFDFLATKAAWGVSLLGFLLMFIALSRVALSQNAQKFTPAFIWIALAFMIYTLINSLIQWNSFSDVVGGFKRYFQVWGLIFALCWLVFDEHNMSHLQVFIVIIALIQLPFALYERIVYVPIREAQQYLYPGMIPLDVVGGTFGASLTGGGASGEMATFLIMMLAFLLARRMEGLVTTNRLILLVLIITAPLFVGETKVVVIMLPLMFLVLYRREMIKRLHYWLMGMIVVVSFTMAAGYTYLSQSDKAIEEVIDTTFNYNLYEHGHGGYHLNRTKVLTFWVDQQGFHDPISFVFGNGLGSSHGGGYIAKHYPNHGIGLTAASTLLWDTGVFGFCLFIAIFVLAWRCADQLWRESAEPTIRADAAAIQAALALFVFYIFYRIGVLEILSFQVIFALLLGYLGWLHRRHVLMKSNK